MGACSSPGARGRGPARAPPAGRGVSSELRFTNKHHSLQLLARSPLTSERETTEHRHSAHADAPHSLYAHHQAPPPGPHEHELLRDEGGHHEDQNFETSFEGPRSMKKS